MCKDTEERIDIAQKEKEAWDTYVDMRRHDLTEEYDMDDKELYLFKEIWDRQSDRKTYLISSDKILDFHHVRLSSSELC
jgi:hypothetical protein